MKNSCIAIILAASAFTGSAQVDFGHNYVREITPGRPYAAGSSTQLVLADSSTMVTSRYFDGIGRQVLEVQRGVGRGGHDVGRMLEYDLAGKVSRAWVPVGLPGSDGGYASADEVRSGAAEIYGDDVNAFSEVFYEFNALKRPWYEIMPGGKAASRHPSYTHYFPNDSTGERACRLLKVDYDGKLTVNGFYRPCGLGIKSTTDADGRTTMEFEDTQGRVVLIRRSTGEAGRPYADTYFVYDIYNNLRVAVSPEAAMQLPDCGEVDGAILDDLCQQFRYDVLNRRIWAKAPGCEPEYRVYGPLDLPLMVQLPAQRAKNEWTVFKYDHLFRKVMEGTVTCRTPHSQLIEMYADSIFTEHVVPGHSEVEYGLQYSHRSGPSGFKALRAWYYDDYSFALNCPTVSDATFSSDFASSALGLCTGSAVIDGGIGLYTAVRYDDYDRPVASVQWNPFGNGDFITELKSYDFRGNVVRRKVIWEKMAEWTALSRREANWRTAYDVANRPLSVDFSPDGQAWTTLGAYTYDDAGRIVRIDGACQEVFARNVRGQITSLSSGPLFRQYISYEDLADSVPHSHTGIPTKIREKGFGAENTFSIAYDGLGRLVGYSNPTGSIQENIEYDLNTNPTGILRRYNDVVVQDAAITYSGNQIAAIADAGSDALAGKVPAWTAGYYENPIEYDAAGRPLSDTSRGISSIKYHSWGDCISRVDFTSGNRLTMTYRPDGFLKARRYDRYRTTLTPRVDANGDTTWRSVRKLESSNIQSYAGPFETTNGSTTVQTGFGHWSYADSTHVWYARDFRGSVRNTVQINPSTGRKQMAAHMFFYPSGLPVKVAGAWRTDRIFQDKEWIDGDGVGWYDNAARIYDPIGMRFLTPDAKWTDDTANGPYTYCLGNPIGFTDRNGYEPNPTESAIMCWIVSFDFLSNDILPIGLGLWRLSDFNTSITMNYLGDGQNGLKSALFERELPDGTKEYAYVFAGSNTARDWIENGLQLIGRSPQYDQAIKNGIILSNELGTAELTFLGHSKGGGQGGACSMATGRKAITFNAAPLSPATKERYNLEDDSNIINYRIAPIRGEGIRAKGGCGISNFFIEIGMPAAGLDVPIYFNNQSWVDSHYIINFVEYFLTQPQP